MDEKKNMNSENSESMMNSKSHYNRIHCCEFLWNCQTLQICAAHRDHALVNHHWLFLI